MVDAVIYIYIYIRERPIKEDNKSWSEKDMSERDSGTSVEAHYSLA